jgi:hypothetical protein
LNIVDICIFNDIVVDALKGDYPGKYICVLPYQSHSGRINFSVGARNTNIKSSSLLLTVVAEPSISYSYIVRFGSMSYLMVYGSWDLECLGSEVITCNVDGVDSVGKIKSIKIIDSVWYPILSSDAALAYSIVAPIVPVLPTANTIGTVTLFNNTGLYSSNISHGLSKGRYANIYFPSLTTVPENNFTVKTVLDSKRFIFDYSDPNINPAIEIETGAVINYTEPANLFADVNIIRESSGYWLNSRGKLSELVYVHGPAVNSIDRSKIFYQPYSYVVKSDVSLAEWNTTASQLIHPAGTEVFGEIDINKEISGNLEPTGLTEVWDYFGLTADCNVFPASLTTYTNSRVTNLSVTTDMVYTVFGYL